MDTKKAIFNIVELIPNKMGQLHGYVTQKHPLIDLLGVCIGVTGVCQKKAW